MRELFAFSLFCIIVYRISLIFGHFHLFFSLTLQNDLQLIAMQMYFILHPFDHHVMYRSIEYFFQNMLLGILFQLNPQVLLTDREDGFEDSYSWLKGRTFFSFFLFFSAHVSNSLGSTVCP